MSVKKQFAVLKENWLLVVLGVIVLVVISGGLNFSSNLIGQGFDGVRSLGASYDKGYGMMEEMGVASSSYYPGVSADFAPGVEDRKIVKSSSLSTEVERGEFKDNEARLKNIITSSDSYLISENVNRNGEGFSSYFYGYYSLRVDVEKYDSVISQLKEIGEVQYFSENRQDVTGSYEDLSIELAVEKDKLAKYEEMYGEAKDVKEKLDLTDRIFSQERRVKYLEDSLNKIDVRVEYSTISFSMNEKGSSWVGVAIIGFSDLVKACVSSLNSLLRWIFVLLPWAVAFGIIRWIWKKFRK